MANSEHVQLARRRDWNKWRADHPDVIPDLSDATLSYSDLHRADLSRAKLGRADLAGSNLSGANLGEADLSGAKLSGAKLWFADFTRADLNGADLSGADLRGAKLCGTKLSEADLTMAALYETNFSVANLRGAKGLSECEFRGPCILDHRAIQLSGRLPESFLRGCGLPGSSLIEYLPSLLNEAIQFFSCFISYSTKDQDFANRLYADLQARGVRCWFAPHDIQGGRKIHEQIDDAIRVYDKLLLILSDASMNSPWVNTEIANARSREDQQKRQMLFPITLVPFDRIKEWRLFDADRGIDSAREIREYFIPDFSSWKDHDSYTKAFERLLRDLKSGARDGARLNTRSDGAGTHHPRHAAERQHVAPMP